MTMTTYSPDAHANLTLSTWQLCLDSPVAKWMNSAANTISFMVGVPVNSWVLWLIVTGVEGTMVSEVFTVSLAVSELLFNLNSPIATIYGHVFLSDTLGSILMFASGFTMVGRPLFHCCTCVERYLAVVHPLIYLRYRPPRYRLVCSAVVWLLTLGYSTVVSVLFPYEPVHVYICFFMVLIIVKTFCSISLLRALVRPGPGDGERERPGLNLAKLRAFRVVLVILVSTLVTYLPIIIGYLLYINHRDTTFCVFSPVCFTLTVFNGFVQPLLYLHRAGKLPCIRIS